MCHFETVCAVRFMLPFTSLCSSIRSIPKATTQSLRQPPGSNRCCRCKWPPGHRHRLTCQDMLGGPGSSTAFKSVQYFASPPVQAIPRPTLCLKHSQGSNLLEFKQILGPVGGPAPNWSTDDLLLLLFLQASVSVESLSCRQTSFFCQARRMCSLLPTARKGARDCNLTLWCAEISNSFIPEWFHENDNWTAMQCLPQARRGCWLNNRNFHDGRCWWNLPRPYWQVADRRIASDTQ